MRLIVDANILMGELLRKRGRKLIKNPELELYISERVFSEANYELTKRVNLMTQQGKFDYSVSEYILVEAKLIIHRFITIIPLNDYQHLENKAKNLIPRDPNDWEMVAISLLFDVDIWTQDCDFIGCGRATWTTETLIYILNI